MAHREVILFGQFLGLLRLAILVYGQQGFISIDCGYVEQDYMDPNTMITYTSDAKYIDTGESMRNLNSALSSQYQSLRRFTQGKRNCYNVTSLASNRKYLIRASFVHGNYDSSFQIPKFDLYLGVDLWYSVSFQSFSDQVWAEIISLIKSDHVVVCLVNTGHGTPFINVLELRPLPSFMYTIVNGSWSLTTLHRIDAGSLSTVTLRYGSDPYDRFWVPYTFKDWIALNTSSTIIINQNNQFQPPLAVMQTAAQSSNRSTGINISWEPPTWAPDALFYFNFYFALTQVVANSTRVLTIFLNGERWGEPLNLLSPTMHWSGTLNPERRSQKYEVDIRAYTFSDLPPIINAFEIYMANAPSSSATEAQDVAALLDIKDKLGLKNKSWVGDPCLPQEYQWDSLTCNQEQNPRVISLDLSASRLEGEIPASIADLSVLESLDLSQNNLSGQVPMALIEKNTSGALVLRIHENSNLSITNSYQPPRQTKSKKTVAILVISVASAVSLLFALVVGLIVKKIKVLGEEKLCNKERDDTPKPDATRAFTHAEIVKITNDFEKVIGKGGYGPVFYGCLENGHEVAVKLLSQESQQGYKEFLAEVKLLIRIHHKYLVSFIGFCDEGPEKILVYEYMSKGNLKEILSDKNRNSVSLNWEQRLRIALSVAQGLEYLHCGCKPPIIHRDVKTVNILLNENLEAKVADFGLSRLGPTEDDTHIWTIAAGTPGYVDPEYNITNKLTEKSDVYSFGIVLLELISGQPAIILDEERLHIVHWVTPKIKTGDIVSVVDPRLQGEYDINSMWKAVEIALACTPETAVRRPTISDVIGELRGCVELESSCRRRTSRTEYHTSSPITASINMEKEPGFDPSPR
ncbi:hypothetical protein AMTRI_Chr05g67850 [Amborella trichopoda]